jgi:hypothetical protein
VGKTEVEVKPANTTSEPFVDDAIVSSSSSPDVVKAYDTGADFTKDIGLLQNKGPRDLQKTSWASGGNEGLLDGGLEDDKDGKAFN